MKVYRIKNVKTDKYVSVGYNQKSSWKTFPSEAIKINSDTFNQAEFDDFEVEVYELKLVQKLYLNKKGDAINKKNLLLLIGRRY